MVTCYPGNNSRYIAHIDNPDNNGRVLTCIIYLNKYWKSGDGGELRIYDHPFNKDEL
jgi:hypoxia-inducible factor (prolyl hydroxylase)